MRVFVLYDIKAEAWMTPFMSRNNHTAFREIQHAMRHAPGEDVVASNKGDFELYVIGNFDQAEGVLTACAVEPLGTVQEICTGGQD